MSDKESVAIIGGGVAGISTAYLLKDLYDVSIYEAGDYLGGHTATIEVDQDGKTVPVDTGFIVLNDKTYPNFTQFLAELHVPIRYADMSFSFDSGTDGFHYAGTGLKGLFADRKRLMDLSYWKFISGIKHFSKIAAKELELRAIDSESLEQFFKRRNIDKKIAERYVLPVGASIWSTPSSEMLKYPARTFLTFFKNHGLLSLKDRPRWQTVVGGSYQYVKAFQKIFNGDIKLSSPVSRISREGGQVHVESNRTKSVFDKVVIALHADRVLNVLADPSNEEKEAFSVWEYNKNHTVLHTDESLMPKNKRAWASWNYLHQYSNGSNNLSVTYAMNRLQGLDEKTEYFVTLNSFKEINPNKIIREFDYDHPLYTMESIRSQELIKNLNGENNTYYCGSYHGYGFHEDAVKSGNEVSRLLGGRMFHSTESKRGAA